MRRPDCVLSIAAYLVEDAHLLRVSLKTSDAAALVIEVLVPAEPLTDEAVLGLVTRGLAEIRVVEGGLSDARG